MKEIREKSSEELAKAIALRQEALRDLRFNHTQRQVKNFQEMKATRRDIARMKTERNSRNK